MIKTFRFDNSPEFSSNTYVIGDENGNCVVVDPGSTSDRVIDYIKSNYKTCKGILLTHGHWDHVRGVNKLLKWDKKITVFISEYDEEMLYNSRLNCAIVLDKFSGTIKTKPYIFENGDELKFSDDLVFEVIDTPFHTQGSVCFLYKKENSIFTGDTLFKGSIGRTDLPHSDSKSQKESLSILKNLDASLKVYPGHGDETTLANEFETNIYLR